MPLKDKDKNRDYHKEYMRAWRKNNPNKRHDKTYQERLEYNREYNRKNKERLSERKRKYYQENKEYFKEKINAWYQKNKERVAVKTRELRKEVIEHYGAKCVCCGETKIEFLALDHKNNDGAKHRKEIKTTTVFRWAKANNYPDNLQILCHNCNMSKALYGYCPHQKEKQC